MMQTDDLIRRLEAISEELGDLAIARLRDALQGNDLLDGKPADAAADEKTIARARRSVDKAVSILAGMPQSEDF